MFYSKLKLYTVKSLFSLIFKQNLIFFLTLFGIVDVVAQQKLNWTSKMTRCKHICYWAHDKRYAFQFPLHIASAAKNDWLHNHNVWINRTKLIINRTHLLYRFTLVFFCCGKSANITKTSNWIAVYNNWNDKNILHFTNESYMFVCSLEVCNSKY